MLIQITDMSELGDAFIIWGWEASTTHSKTEVLAITALTWACVMGREELLLQ